MTDETSRLVWALVDRVMKDATETVEQIQYDDRVEALAILHGELEGTPQAIAEQYDRDDYGRLINDDDRQGFADARARERGYFADRRAA
jgi:hypothetical protein